METNAERRVPVKTDIIVRAKDGAEITERCIRSIRENTLPEAYRIILVDDGSDPPLFEQLDDPGDLYIARPEPGGAVSATNLGLSASLTFEDSGYIMVMDNDAWIPDGDDEWLFRFIMELNEFPDTAVVGATTGYANPPQHILLSPPTFAADWRDNRDPRRRGIKDNPPVRSLVSFSCLMKKEVIQQIGMWDTRYDPGNYEDTDFAVMVRTAGWNVRVARSVYIHHDGHQTFSTDLQSLLAKNHEKFVDKWGAGRLMDLGMIRQEGAR